MDDWGGKIIQLFPDSKEAGEDEGLDELAISQGLKVVDFQVTIPLPEFILAHFVPLDDEIPIEKMHSMMDAISYLDYKNEITYSQVNIYDLAGTVKTDDLVIHLLDTGELGDCLIVSSTEEKIPVLCSFQGKLYSGTLFQMINYLDSYSPNSDLYSGQFTIIRKK